MINLEEKQQQEIDLDKVYEYDEFPDKVSGRCDQLQLSLLQKFRKRWRFLT